MEHALAAIVGMMFFVSGMSKAIHSGPFLSHIQQLGWVPMAMTPVVCVAVTGCELGLAAALLNTQIGKSALEIAEGGLV